MRLAPFLALSFSVAVHAAVAALLLVRPTIRQEEVGPPPRLAGETFELPAPEVSETPLSNASPSPDTQGTPAEVDAPDAPARPAPPQPAHDAARPSHAGRPSAGRADPNHDDGTQGAPPGALYGAVGDRSAAPLAPTFARAFTQTASADPAWQKAPLGSAGSATVTLSIDEAGALTQVEIGGSPSAALRSSIDRTLSLIRGRAFVARGRRTTVHLSASVGEGGAADDGLEGDRFGIAIHEGNASFVLPIGRRIQVRVR